MKQRARRAGYALRHAPFGCFANSIFLQRF
jgi:hypothetical protein